MQSEFACIRLTKALAADPRSGEPPRRRRCRGCLALPVWPALALPRDDFVLGWLG